MGYRIDEVAGIDPRDAERLTGVGITSTDDLLGRCATAHARQEVATRTGIAKDRLADWHRQADLMRVSGIGAEYGRLLERSGIENVRMLATRKAENVVNLLDRVNRMQRLTHAVPSMRVVTKWIARARTLEQLPPANGRSAEPVRGERRDGHHDESTGRRPAETATGATPGGTRASGDHGSPARAPDGNAGHGHTRPPVPTEPGTRRTPYPMPPSVPRHRPMGATPVATGTGSRPGYPVAPAKPVW